MLFNLENHGISGGRLTADPLIYKNADGSHKVLITIASPNAYKNQDGTRGAQFLPLEAFIPASRTEDGNGIYDMMHKGDRVIAQYSVRNNNYTDRSGRKVYGLTLHIDAIKMTESLSAVQARSKNPQSRSRKKVAA